ncbi:MAG: ABC transporter permease subunit [Candidatus Rokubacteria bacterium]|nr:ABC transporter permease subunit [Candidatus Rokubacteria bacterium]
MDLLIHYFFNLGVMRRYLPDLLDGLLVTVAMAVLIITIGLTVGFALAVIRAFQLRPVNWVLVPLVDLFRAVPPLVIIVVVYFALPYAGIRLSSFASTVASLAAVLAAFSEEIFWAGIISVERGQWEAARSTGLGHLETLALVVLPQAVRLAIPPLTNWTIAITKGTALGSAVAAQEIISRAQSAQSIAANPSPLTLGALLYLAIFVPFVVGSRWVERRFGWRR